MPSEEKYFETDSVKDDTLYSKNNFEKGGQTILFVVAFLILLGLGAPVILILIKSPPPDQHLFILGVSYF